MAAVGDAHVTEMLTPLVNLTTALLTPQFLQVSVQIQNSHLQCTRHGSLTSSCMFSQQAATTHIYCALLEQRPTINVRTIIQTFGCENSYTRIVFMFGESTKSENLRGSTTNSSNITLRPLPCTEY